MIIRWGWGWGVGGCINVLDERFLYVTEDAHVAHCRMITRRGFPALAFSLQMEPEVLQPVVTKIIPTKGSRWPKSTTKNISLLRLSIFQVVCGVNPIETIVAGTQKNGWNMETREKMATSVDAPQKKQTKRVQKKVHLGLQLEMASQRCLVADCGFCFATSALAPLASRRGKNWKSECRPDMIRVVENYRFQTFFWTLEEQNRVNAQAKRKFSLLSHTPANRNECPCCKHFLTTPANINILSLTFKNQNFKFVTLTRAPSQPVALFIHQSYPKKVASWSLNSTPAIMLDGH